MITMKILLAFKMIAVITALFVTSPTALGQNFSGNLSGEFVVNDDIVTQDHATAAMFADGSFAITWHSWHEESTGLQAKVYCARYDAKGCPIGDIFMVNENITNYNSQTPDIATYKTASDGRFAVTWSHGLEDWPPPDFGPNPDAGSMNPSGSDRSPFHDCAAAQPNSQGSSDFGEHYTYVGLYLNYQRAPEFPKRVSRNESDTMTWPDAAMFDDGGFIVVWGERIGDLQDFYAMLFNPSGEEVYDEPFKLNVKTSDLTGLSDSGTGLPDVECNDKGQVIVVWEQRNDDTGDFEIYHRYFYTQDPHQNTLSYGRIKEPVAGINQRRPVVDLNDDEQIVVTWSDKTLSSRSGIQRQTNHVSILRGRLEQGTSPYIEWFDTICPHTGMNGIMDHRSTVRFIDHRYFIVGWTHQWDEGECKGDDVYVRIYRFDENLGKPNKIGPPICVHNNPLSRIRNQRRPALDLVFSRYDLQIVVTWEDDKNSGIAGEGDWDFDIYGRCYFAQSLIDSYSNKPALP